MEKALNKLSLKQSEKFLNKESFYIVWTLKEPNANGSKDVPIGAPIIKCDASLLSMLTKELISKKKLLEA